MFTAHVGCLLKLFLRSVVSSDNNRLPFLSILFLCIRVFISVF